MSIYDPKYSPESLLQKALLWDIEATGLGRDTSTHQAAFHFWKDKTTVEFLLNPNLTEIELGIKQQDLAGQRSSPSDSIRFYPDMDPKDPDAIKRSLAAQLINEEAKLGLLDKGTPDRNTVSYLMLPENKKEFITRMEASMGFTHASIMGGKFPRLTEAFDIDVEEARKTQPPLVQRAIADFEALKQKEIDAGKYTVHNNVTVQEFLYGREGKGGFGGLSQAAKTHTVWIANVDYESKQIGAKVAAIEADSRRMFLIKSLGEETSLKRFKAMGMDDKEAEALIKRAKGLTKADLIKRMGHETPIRAAFKETVFSTTDLFSVTGKEVNFARAFAKMTGNWKPVFEAYLHHTNAGDVRDIMDVIRAQLSFSRDAGLIKSTKANAVSMDIAYRLYGASTVDDIEDVKRYLLSPELHTAGADVRVTSSLVLEESLMQTHSLYMAHEQDLSKADILRKVVNAKGRDKHLKGAVKFAQLFEAIGPTLEQFHVEKRLHRALTDLTFKGKSVQTSGAFSPRMVERMVVSGAEEGDPKVTKNKIHAAHAAAYNTYETMDDVVDHLRTKAGYSKENVEIALSNFLKRKGMSDLVKGKDLPNLLSTMKGQREVRGTLSSVEKELNKLMAGYFDEVASNIKSTDMSVYDGISRMNTNTKKLAETAGANWKAMSLADGKVLRSAGLYGGAIAATVGLVGFSSNLLFGRHEGRHGDETLRTVNFHKWLENNQEYAGIYDPSKDSSGMSPVGIGAKLRRMTTDFGSPYRGPVYSQYIFEHQDLMRERERYSRQIFSRRHFSTEGDIGSFLFKNTSNKVLHSINIAGKEVTGHGYSGLMKDSKLIKMDLDNYKISVEDADTIVLKRRGPSNFLAGMFGLNTDATETRIRLAGIDAPETAHRDRKAMPYANIAKGTLEGMLNANNLEVLIDPSNVTYGRVLGTVFADGRNLSTQMLKRGLVAHLPFRRKGVTQMEDNMIYSKHQALAQGADSNMWGDPMFRAYEDIVKSSGKVMTFNSLINPKTAAKDSGLMSTVGLMRSASDMGFYGTSMQTEAALIGQQIRSTGFKSDWKTPELMRGGKQAPHKNYINYLVQDVTNLSRYREKSVKDRTKASKVSSLNKAMTLDTLGTSNSIYNSRKLFAYQNYGVDRERRMRMKRSMAEMQVETLKNMNRSPIEHWRM